MGLYFSSLYIDTKSPHFALTITPESGSLNDIILFFSVNQLLRMFFSPVSDRKLDEEIQCKRFYMDA